MRDDGGVRFGFGVDRRRRVGVGGTIMSAVSGDGAEDGALKIL
jgi:hypothetical protein